jgi:hypothetical protein
MLGLAQAVHASQKSGAAKSIFTAQRLRRLAVWGATAAGALCLAVYSSRNEIGAQRVASILHGGAPTQVAAQKFDPEAETRRLADAVRGLAADDAQIKSRLAAVEHGVDDITGSISKKIETASAARNPPTEYGPTAPATAAVTIALAPLATRPAIVAAAPAAPAADAAAPATSLPTEYGVDIGSGMTIEALRARWLAIYTAHPELFDGLKPIVAVKEVARTNRVELRLVAGPIAQAGAAKQLCAALSQFGLFCQPTLYDGQRLALR